MVPPELVSEEEVPLEVPLVEGDVLLLVPEVPLPEPDEPEDMPELPELPELPEDEPLLLGVSTVVVVVTLPEDGLAPVAELDFEGSLVVVVVVVCPYVIVAVPINDRKMAIGNFFMLAP